MSKTDKELAVDIAISYISSRSVTSAAGSVGLPISTPPATPNDISVVISSAYKTIKNLDSE